MDWQKVGNIVSSFAPAVGAGVSFLGNIFGNKQSKDNVREQIAAQQAENEKNRQFNAREAEKNRLFQQSQILDYRRYNSPVNQARLFEQAGFHPLSSVGQFGSMDAGISSGSSASYSGGISPVGYQPFDATAVGRQIAETRLLNAQADKAESEAHHSEASAITLDSMRAGELALQNVKVLYAKDMADWQLQQLKNTALNIEQVTENAKAMLDSIVQQGKHWKLSVWEKELDVAWKDDTFQSRVRQEAVRVGISEIEYKYLAASFAYRLASAMADPQLKLAQAMHHSAMAKFLPKIADVQERGIKLKEKEYDQFSTVRYTNFVRQNALLGAQKDRVVFDLGQSEKWDDTLKSLRVYDSVTGSIMDFFGTWDSFGEYQDRLFTERYSNGNGSYVEKKTKSRVRVGNRFSVK